MGENIMDKEAIIQECAKKFLVIQPDGSVYIGRRMFTVREISVDEIQYFRRKKIPSLLIKKDGKYYHSQISANNSVTYTTTHCCCDGRHDCVRLLAKPTSEGGCDKTMSYSRRIETHDFVKTGYETFGTVKDSYIVVECACYEKEAARNSKQYLPVMPDLTRR